MEAHALVARSCMPVKFPFLVLLVSGGHCQIAVVRDVSDFVLLGSTCDDAPGEAFDKAARRLKLSNMDEYRALSGGAAIERLARHGDPMAIEFTSPMTKRPDCDFSFSGALFTQMCSVAGCPQRAYRRYVNILKGQSNYYIYHYRTIMVGKT